MRRIYHKKVQIEIDSIEFLPQQNDGTGKVNLHQGGAKQKKETIVQINLAPAVSQKITLYR